MPNVISHVPQISSSVVGLQDLLNERTLFGQDTIRYLCFSVKALSCSARASMSQNLEFRQQDSLNLS